MTQPRALLHLLDSLEEWNSYIPTPKDRDPEPEGTQGIQVDEATANEIAWQIGIPARLVRICLIDIPVKQAKAARDWVLSHEKEQDYDPALLLFRFTNARVRYVSALTYEQIMGTRAAKP